MRSPAGAFAWEFGQRHRVGLLGIAGYFVILAVIRLLPSVRLDSPESFAFGVFVPLSAALIYCLAVFTFGFSGDLAARASIYPRRLFTLPVSNAALAGWPMLYGTVAMALVWIATRLLAPWPQELPHPLLWPACLAAVLLAWAQALTWMPYGLRTVRVLVTLLCLTLVDVVIIWAIALHASEGAMLAILVPQLPLAYVVARIAVGRARRGEVPDWRGLLGGRVGNAATPARGPRPAFGSALHAQGWLEWRRQGASLPTLVIMVLPFELALLWLARGAGALVLDIVGGVLLTPPFLAVFAAARVRESGADGGDAYGLTSFLATRPISGGFLAVARMRMAAWSTLAAWLAVAIALPPTLHLSGTAPLVAEAFSHFAHAVGTVRALTIALLVPAGLVGWTWAVLVQGQLIGLTGRAWLVKGSVFGMLGALVAIGMALQWLSGNVRALDALWDALLWISAVLVALKMSAASWLAVRLHRSRLLSDGALVMAAGCWLMTVLAIYGTLVWWVGTPLFPHYWLVLLAMLLVPLARVAGMPLAIAWSRHR